jgi:protein SCO1/2
MSDQAVAASPTDARSSRARRGLSPLVRMGIFLTGLVLVALVYARFLMHRVEKPLPVLGQLPKFALVDQSGNAFTDGSLRGHVWVADFIFTRCQASCPLLTQRMKTLQGMLTAEQAKLGATGTDARLVSFSVDPENDTPLVLSDYATLANADTKIWSFVTGPSDAVRAAVVDGFKMTMEKQSPTDVLHGNWLILGDRDGNIRGYFEVKTDADVEDLEREVRRLDAEPVK